MLTAEQARNLGKNTKRAIDPEAALRIFIHQRVEAAAKEGYSSITSSGMYQSGKPILLQEHPSILEDLAKSGFTVTKNEISGTPSNYLISWAVNSDAPEDAENPEA